MSLFFKWSQTLKSDQTITVKGEPTHKPEPVLGLVSPMGWAFLSLRVTRLDCHHWTKYLNPFYVSQNGIPSWKHFVCLIYLLYLLFHLFWDYCCTLSLWEVRSMPHPFIFLSLLWYRITTLVVFCPLRLVF